MTWTKLCDSFYDDPRLMRAGEDAADLHVRAMVYCNRYGTDGMVPRWCLSAISRKPTRAVNAMVKALVEAGVWTEKGEGWALEGFLDTQPSSAEVKAKREAVSEARSRAGKAGNTARWDRKPIANRSQTDRNEDGKTIASASQTDRPVPSRPVPVPVQPQSATRSDAGVRAREAGRGEGAPPPRAETAPQSPPRAPSVEATGYDAASLISDLQRHASRHLLLGGACDGGTELALSRVMRDLTARGVPAATSEGYRTLAAWIAAGGWAWRDVPAGTGALARPGALLDALGQADAWHRAGRGPVAVRGKRVSRDHVMTVEEADAQIAAEKAAGPAGLVF